MRQIGQEELEKLPYLKQIMFAYFCAEQVFYLVNEEHKEVCRVAIETIRKFALNEVTKKDCVVVANAVYATYATSDGSYAVYTVYSAVNVAPLATHISAYAVANIAAAAVHTVTQTELVPPYQLKKKQKTIEEQWNFYDQLLNGDKHFEEIILKEKT